MNWRLGWSVLGVVVVSGALRAEEPLPLLPAVSEEPAIALPAEIEVQTEISDQPSDPATAVTPNTEPDPVEALRQEQEQQRAQIAELQKELQQAKEKLTATVEQVAALEAKLTDANARIGEILSRVAAPEEVRFSPRGGSNGWIRVYARIPNQGPSAVTFIETASGARLQLIGDQPVPFDAPNTGILQYRFDGDARGFDRILTWEPAQVEKGPENRPQVRLSLPLQ